MPRFVILLHECPLDFERPTHFDLMLEDGDTLRTWALESEPRAGEAIAAVFPGGTITGVPKVRCMELIAELARDLGRNLREVPLDQIGGSAGEGYSVDGQGRVTGIDLYGHGGNELVEFPRALLAFDKLKMADLRANSIAD